MFKATTKVMNARGYGGCSMDAVAKELGCSGQALGRRFGSRRGLVRSYLEWILALTAERFQESRRAFDSPLTALRARCLIPAEERPEELLDPVDPAKRANMGTFWAAVRSDPELRVIAAQSAQDSTQEVVELLEMAILKGELIPCDHRELGRTLIAAWVGTNTLWECDGPDGTLVEQLGHVFDVVIGPYRKR